MHTKHGTRQVLGVMLYCSLTALAACLTAGTPADAIRGLLAILRSPAQLTTDAFLIGGLSGAFLNAGLAGLCCTGVMALFMAAVCVGLLLAGFMMNGRSFRGYGRLFFCSGYRSDFTRTLGMPLTLIHTGIFGLLATLYYYLIGAPMNGPTLGSIICLLAIAPCGAHLLNVLPIMAGYGLASVLFHFQLSTQSIVVGFSFACALCQIAGHFGALCGVAAGFLHACLVTTVVGIHGGFCLYNGGFTSGICAILMVPVLETFFMPMDRLHLIPRRLKLPARQAHAERREHHRDP